MLPSSCPPIALDDCLFLDVDGTLMELHDSPFDTRADAELTTLLAAVSQRQGGALALISGRSIEFLDQLFAPWRLPCAGLHGLERRAASGALTGATRHDERLDAARASLNEWVRRHPGTLLEDKGRTVAIHYRLAPQFETAVRESVAATVASLGPGYHSQPGNMMVEIKPQGADKGSAVTEFLREAPFAGRRPVYVGDDLTDLDGFAAVEAAGGISIAVGGRVAARYRLATPADVRGWLSGQPRI